MCNRIDARAASTPGWNATCGNGVAGWVGGRTRPPPCSRRCAGRRRAAGRAAAHHFALARLYAKGPYRTALQRGIVPHRNYHVPVVGSPGGDRR